MYYILVLKHIILRTEKAEINGELNEKLFFYLQDPTVASKYEYKVFFL